MENTYEYFQPEYVSKFQCNGQKCSAKCCKGWSIFIDKKTYKKYSHIKPKSSAQEIMRHITKTGGNDYQLVFGEKNCCPFLTEDNWCNIQRKYGEGFLSEVCATYPRRISDLYKFHECVLSLSCPLAAELILLADEPLKFETVEIPENVHSGYLITVPDFDKNTVIFIIDIQKTAITILQERNLTIDGRLFMLGMYLDKLNESAFNGVMTSYEFEQMNQTYKDTNFLQEQAAQFSAVIKFNAHNYTRIMSELLNLILSKQTERNIFDAITKTLNLSADLERKKFIGKFSTIFENYLVNELLFNLYPFRFEGNINLSYGVFVMTYKILELITFSMAMGNDFSEKNLVNQIIDYANKIDHGGAYFEKISDYMKDKDDIVEIMQNMLQV